MTDSKTIECPYCRPWDKPKPIVNTGRFIVRLVVKADMYRYIQVLRYRWGKWRECDLQAINVCPICGKEV